MIDPSGIISTIVGSGPTGVNAGSFAGDGGPATEARLSEPIGVVFDQKGNLLFSDRDNHRIRMVDDHSTITTIAGTGEAGSDGDGGPATRASLDQPYYLVVEGEGNIIFADSGANRVRMIDGHGTITTIAGTGEAGSDGDGGLAAQAKLNEPYGVALDATDDLFISELSRVREVNVHGVITTVAGTGDPSFSGDGGAATAASVSPYGILTDRRGNLYIADGGNARVRVVNPNGLIRSIVSSAGP